MTEIWKAQRALPLYTDPVPTDEALLRQALEALESCDGYIEQLELIVYSPDDTGTHYVRAKVRSTIATLKERLAETTDDLTRCPNCGGPADNGHDREVPPNPYWCSKCSES